MMIHIPELRQQHNPLCITIILPLASGQKAETHNKGQLFAALDELTDTVHRTSADPALKKAVLNRLKQLDRTTLPVNVPSVGIYVTPQLSYVCPLSFPAKSKAIIDSHLHLRELMYMDQYEVPYCVLDLEEESFRIFRGKKTTLTEIVKEDFPKIFEGAHEYVYHTLGHLFDYPFGELEEDLLNHQLEFLQHADGVIEPFITRHTPLLVSGPAELTSLYMQLTSHKAQSTILPLDHVANNLVHAGNRAWKKLVEYIDNREVRRKHEIRKKLGMGLAVTGLRQVWQMAARGQGGLLLIEKDYAPHAFCHLMNREKIYLAPPSGLHRYCEDAGEELIRMVEESGGNIHFLPNGSLDAYGKVALFVR